MANQCPVGLITNESRQLAEVFERSQFVPGTSLFGPDLSEWPARMVDAAAVIEQERNRVENARVRAEMEDDG